MSDLKPNFSELSRQYAIDRRTIKKYHDGYEGKPASHNKLSRLDQYQDLIVNKLSIKGTKHKREEKTNAQRYIINQIAGS